MSYIKLMKEIKRGTISPVYLFYGSEVFLIDDAVQQITKNVLSSEEIDFKLSKYDMIEQSIDIAVEEALTFPFMGGRKIVIIQNAYFLTGQKIKSSVEHDLSYLSQYLENPAPETVFILIVNHEKLDERKKLVKLAKKSATIMDASAFNENEVKSWIEERATEASCVFTEEAKQKLIQLTSANLMLMASEIKKLALYPDIGEQVSADIVIRLVPRTLEQDIFMLVEDVVSKNIQRAMQIYKDLLKQKEAPLKILALMVRQFRILYQVNYLMKQGYSEKHIAGQLKLHPYVVKLTSQKARKLKEDDLIALIDELAELDYKIKTGGVQDKLGVELFILKRVTKSSV